VSAACAGAWARAGTLRVDDELHLSQLPADEESPEVETFRDQLDHRIGEVQLPDAILDGFERQVAVRWSPSTERLERGGRSQPS